MILSRLDRLRRKGSPQASAFRLRRVRFYLAAFGLLLAGFIAGFHLFFPAGTLRQRLEREIAGRTPLAAEIEETSLLFPLGLQASGIRLGSGSPPDGLTVAELRLTPLWRQLAGSNPGLAFRARVLGGDVAGSWRKNGSIEATLQKLSFSAPVGTVAAPLLLRGELDQGELSGAYPLAAANTRLALHFDRMELSGLGAFGLASDTLALGNVELTGSGRGNALKVERLTASGGNLEISAEGTVMLAEPLERSRLNLNLVLRPGRQLDQAFTDLLELLAKADKDGSYRLRLTGALTQPAVQ